MVPGRKHWWPTKGIGVTRGGLRTRPQSIGRAVALFVCALAVVTALGTSVAGAAPKGKTKTQCKVPKLAKKTEAAAKKALKKANCAAGKVTKKSSQKIAKGKVISSNPKAGSKHPAGTKVKLVVSSGKGKTKTQCIVPKLANKTEADAKKALKKANCAVGTVTQKSSSTVAKGKVISSSPKAGQKRKAGAKVNLVVSSGKTPPAQSCKVPNVVGQSQSAAESAITKANCAVGKVTQKPSNTVAKGKVISTSPKAGTSHKAGAKVNLVVSTGKKSGYPVP